MPAQLSHRIACAQDKHHSQILVLLRRPDLPTGLHAGVRCGMPACCPSQHEDGGKVVLLP
jgi:hypothetical protein